VLTAAKLEVQLRLVDISGRSDPGYNLAAPDFFSAFDENRIAMGISGDPAVGMLDENEIAIPPQLIPSIRDDTRVDGLHCRAARRGDVDAVVVCAIGS
jgi:hypothetical protein